MKTALAASTLLAIAASLSLSAPAQAAVSNVKPGPANILDFGRDYDQSFYIPTWSPLGGNANVELNTSVKSLYDAINGYIAPDSMTLPFVSFHDEMFVARRSRAYATHASDGSATMGLHAESSIDYHVSSLGPAVQGRVGATFDVSYVKPGPNPTCAPLCVAPPPYFSALLTVRGQRDANYSTVFYVTQATPLSGTHSAITFGDPSYEPFDAGIVTLERRYDIDFLVDVTYSLDTTGGSIDLITRSSADLDLNGTFSQPFVDGRRVDGNYAFHAGMLHGVSNDAHALFHTTASMNGSELQFTRSICSRGTGASKVGGPGAWSFDADALSSHGDILGTPMSHFARSGSTSAAPAPFDSGNQCLTF